MSWSTSPRATSAASAPAARCSSRPRQRRSRNRQGAARRDDDDHFAARATGAAAPRRHRLPVHDQARADGDCRRRGRDRALVAHREAERRGDELFPRRPRRPGATAQGGANPHAAAVGMAEDLLDAIRDQLANFAVGLVERVEGAGSRSEVPAC